MYVHIDVYREWYAASAANGKLTINIDRVNTVKLFNLIVME